MSPFSLRQEQSIRNPLPGGQVFSSFFKVTHDFEGFLGALCWGGWRWEEVSGPGHPLSWNHPPKCSHVLFSHWLAMSGRHLGGHPQVLIGQSKAVLGSTV